jgi:hypothetical protein
MLPLTQASCTPIAAGCQLFVTTSLEVCSLHTTSSVIQSPSSSITRICLYTKLYTALYRYSRHTAAEDRCAVWGSQSRQERQRPDRRTATQKADRSGNGRKRRHNGAGKRRAGHHAERACWCRLLARGRQPGGHKGASSRPGWPCKAATADKTTTQDAFLSLQCKKRVCTQC